MARAEQQAVEHALALPAASNRRADLAAVRRRQQASLKSIVARYGWPTETIYGSAAATAAVKIVCCCQDPAFVRQCRDLLLEAVHQGDCQLVHYAFVDDVLSIRARQRQVYGTQVDPRTLRPYPIRDSKAVNDLRTACGLPPLPGMPTDSGLILPTTHTLTVSPRGYGC
ncbi:DUF6624 domain-containing protein [Streptomyces sp. C]|uniref:DUF6624 domain-containing protein n=1 Tax=Streptomyces sp. C TaxID=253839 RepID=UPI000680837B|nr:DUF6624 domain-containing protein [Streptomyces sp. C]